MKKKRRQKSYEKNDAAGLNGTAIMGRYGEIFEKYISTQQRKTKPKEPEWTPRLEEWGTKEIDELKHAYKNEMR